MQYLALSLLLALGAGALPQYLTSSLLLALGAGALPQAPNPATLASSSTPADSNFDKRGDDPVIGYFNDLNCHGEHIGPEIPMTTNCTPFYPYGTYQRIKISWHHGPGKVRFYYDDRCSEYDEIPSSLLVRTDEQHEWECKNTGDFNGIAALMVPQ